MEVTPITREQITGHRDCDAGCSIVLSSNTVSGRHHALAVSLCLHAAAAIALAMQHIGLAIPPRPVGWTIAPMAALIRSGRDAPAATAPEMAALKAATVMATRRWVQAPALAGIAPRYGFRNNAKLARAGADAALQNGAFATPSPAAARPPAAARSGVASPDGAMIAAFEQELGGAIEAAKFYPARARQLGREGSAIVGLVYRDGAVGRVRLQRSAGNTYLDAGALQAVRQARYPMPPPALIGHVFELSLPITFSLTVPVRG